MAFIQKDDLAQLATCHPDLVRVMKRVAEKYDVLVVYGQRTVAEQQALYAQGRSKPGRIVTNLDGVKKKSRHNYSPSMAVDAVVKEYVRSGRWVDTAEAHAQQKQMAAYAKQVAAELGIKDFAWGGDWVSFKDRPHFELTRAAS